jgi:hypothetical protein
MHSAEHRALRELRVFGTQLERHWEHLAGRIGGAEAALLAAGAADARAMLAEVGAAAAARGVPTRPAAALTGRLTSARPPAPDHLLERNQALRFALLDAWHCATLLRYTAALAAGRGDDELRALLERFAGRLDDHAAAVRDAVVALGARPDDAVAPAIPNAAGRLGHRIAASGGALGEWIDRRASARRAG